MYIFKLMNEDIFYIHKKKRNDLLKKKCKEIREQVS